MGRSRWNSCSSMSATALARLVRCGRDLGFRKGVAVLNGVVGRERIVQPGHRIVKKDSAPVGFPQRGSSR